MQQPRTDSANLPTQKVTSARCPAGRRTGSREFWQIAAGACFGAWWSNFAGKSPAGLARGLEGSPTSRYLVGNNSISHSMNYASKENVSMINRLEINSHSTYWLREGNSAWNYAERHSHDAQTTPVLFYAARIDPRDLLMRGWHHWLL